MILAVISQFKFIATYLVPSAYPSMLMALSAIAAFFAPLAQFTAPPHGTEWPFVLNAIAWLGVATIAATLALTLKKLFGRQPSLSEVLSGLVSTKALAEYKEEQRLRSVGLEKQISDARHSFDERANKDLVRTEQTFEKVFGLFTDRDRSMGKMRDSISALTERTESHLRKLDQYDTKLDNLLRDVSAAAARGVRQAQQHD
jgi:hypothetical protein